MLVVYFSKGGNTRVVAEGLSRRLGSDLDEIRERTGGEVDFTRDPGEYGLVIVGSPVHGFTVSKPVARYLEGNRGRFHGVAVYATYSLWAAGTLDKMGQLSGRRPLASAVFKSRDIKLNRVGERLDCFADSIRESLGPRSPVCAHVMDK
jgi:hypothetical protein